jgi:enterochelin esterase-like enzyme
MTFAAVHRRAFLTGLGSLSLAGGAFARVAAAAKPPEAHPVDPPPALTFRTIVIDPSPLYARPTPAVVALPKDLPPGTKLPLAILLPGGEHTMQKREHGCWAWWSDFRLGDLDTALRRGTLTDADLHGFADEAQRATLNARLASHPYRGMAIVTPFLLRRQTELGPHGAMNLPFVRMLVERCRKELPVSSDRASTGLGGVSATGLWALWLGAQLDDLFSAVVAVQPYTDGYEKTLKKMIEGRKQAQSLRIVTSTGDKLHAPALKLIEELRKKGTQIEHAAYPGPHEPKFVQGTGGAEMLLSMTELLAAPAPAPAPAPSPASSPAPSPAPSPSPSPAPSASASPARGCHCTAAPAVALGLRRLFRDTRTR